MKLNVKAFALAVTIFYGAMVLIFCIWHSCTGFGKEFIKIFESIHPGIVRLDFFSEATTGASFVKNIPAILINTIWALIDGLIIGACISLLYNKINASPGKTENKKTSDDSSE